MEENKVVTKGWTAITDTISGSELVWKVEDNGQYSPDVYPTEKDVQKQIADTLIQQLQEFIDDDREYDEVDWEPQDHPVYIEIYEDDSMILWEGSQKFLNRAMTTTLSNWREGL